VSGKLSDKEYIFTLLTALVKRAGGELRITEKEMGTVVRSDVVSLLWDDKNKEIVIRVGFPIAESGYEN
jgi:hypothetical protein